MKPNEGKLIFGSMLEGYDGAHTSSVCHNYGIISGCDEGCPALLDGDCDVPEEAIEHCGFTDEERSEVLEMYN